jgi:hypothetical protein
MPCLQAAQEVVVCEVRVGEMRKSMAQVTAYWPEADCSKVLILDVEELPRTSSPCAFVFQVTSNERQARNTSKKHRQELQARNTRKEHQNNMHFYLFAWHGKDGKLWLCITDARK